MKTHRYAFAVVSLALLFSTTAFGQVPGLDTSNLPGIGKRAVSFKAIADTINVDIAGSDSHWNYSWIKPMGTDSAVTLLQEATPEIGGSSYPKATMAAVTNQGENVDFLAFSEDTVLYYGSTTPNSKIIYSDPIAQAKYPFQFTDDYFDDFKGDVTIGNVTYQREGTVYVNIDAYGSIMLPNISYRKTVRVFSQQEFTDYNPSTSEYTFGTIKTYTYYISGYYNPIVQVTKELYISNSGSTENQTVTYYNKIVSPDGIGPSPKLLANDASLYPNPSQGSAHLRFTAANACRGSLRVFDMTGREIIQQDVNVQAGVNNIPVELTQGTQGLFFVRISTAQGELVQKMIVR